MIYLVVVGALPSGRCTDGHMVQVGAKRQVLAKDSFQSVQENSQNTWSGVLAHLDEANFGRSSDLLSSPMHRFSSSQESGTLE